MAYIGFHSDCELQIIVKKNIELDLINCMNKTLSIMMLACFKTTSEWQAITLTMFFISI
jgi:hypothetical protein